MTEIGESLVSNSEVKDVGNVDVVINGGEENSREVDTTDNVSDMNKDYNCDEQATEEHVTENEDTNKSNKENIEKLSKSKKSSSKSNDSKKKSKSQRKEERLKIQSETHRLMREREIAIPYHVPKQRTLTEFLSRKKNRANIPLNTPTPKMLQIWKEIEESTKNAFEFFKSDSESEDNSCNNEKQGENGAKTQDNSYCNNLEKSGDDKNLNSNLTNGEMETDNSQCINEEVAKTTNNDDNAMFICEDAVIEPDDLLSGKDMCYKSVQEVEDSARDENDGLNDNKGSSNLVVDSIEVESESTDVKDNAEKSDEVIAMERTSEWVKNIPIYEKMLKPSRKELLLQKLNPKLLEITPKLSGEPDSIIDLETDKSIEIGAKKLKKRFLENCLAPRNKPKDNVELTITTSEKNEKGEISRIETEKLIYTSPEVLNDPDLDKPGAKLQRLREELKKKIEAKWEEENRRKLEEMAEEKKKKLEDEEVVEDEEELIDDDEMEESVESSEESEPEEDDVPLTEKKKKKNRFIDSEAEESDIGEEESGNEAGDELDDDDEGRENNGDNSCDVSQQPSMDKDAFPRDTYTDSQSSLIPPYQPGGGMLHGGSELTQSDGDICLPKNVLSPALRLSLDFPASNKNDCSQQPWDVDLDSPEESNTKSNFVPSFSENQSFDLNDAYEFCSGKFPGEGGESQDIRHDETNSQFVTTLDNESQVNSNTFDSLTDKKNDATEEGIEDMAEKKKKRSRLVILSDDSDEEVEKPSDDLPELDDITESRVSLDDADGSSQKSLPIRNRGAKKNLVFSDDEDDPETEKKVTNESDDSVEISSQNGDEDPFADEVDREVVYDSEENEIVNPREYFEKEAELSGSEWSGDEDERDLDELEAEDGDEDKLDERKIRSELERIHMRTLLDDDEREVRLLQELLFEDGDLFDDGPKREKNFRWKNLGAFFDDDQDGARQRKSRGYLVLDDDEDEETRRSRYEKETFLLQMRSKREAMGLDDDDECGISLMKRGRVIIESSSVTSATNKKVAQTIRTETDELSIKTPLDFTNKRGSFLSRNEEFLSRLAKFTSNATDNIFGPKHSKNFVFARKSPEKSCSSNKEKSQPKRKNLSPKGDQAKNKKAKLDTPTTSAKMSILDRLT